MAFLDTTGPGAGPAFFPALSRVFPSSPPSSAPYAATCAMTAAQVANALRSERTPPFGTLVGQLFSHAAPAPQAALVDALLATLDGDLPPGTASAAVRRLADRGANRLTPAQSAQLTAAHVTALAALALARDGRIVDAVSALVAANPETIGRIGGVLHALALTGQPGGTTAH